MGGVDSSKLKVTARKRFYRGVRRENLSRQHPPETAGANFEATGRRFDEGEAAAAISTANTKADTNANAGANAKVSGLKTAATNSTPKQLLPVRRS
jgi:hypothetical protein